MGVSQIFKTLNENKNLAYKLRNIDLSENHIGKSQIINLIDFLKDPKCNLEDLNLYGNLLGDENIITICDTIANYVEYKLTNLNLGKNNITDSCCDVLVNLVKKCSGLRIFIINHNWLHNASATKIMKELINHYELRILDLSWNCIGDDLTSTPKYESLVNKELNHPERLFNNFALKDFANEANAEIFKCDNNLIIKYCYESLKHVWLKENPKVNNILGEFIAHLFTKYFNIYQDQENFDEIKKFENELNRNELLMDIYGVIIKRYLIHYYSPKLEKHIYEFIGNHYYEVDIMSIYYSLLIVKPEDKEEFLLGQLNKELAVQLDDLIDYPTKIHPRIKLFTRLHNENWMNNYRIQSLEYYKLSIEVKDKITSIKYKTAISISKNLDDIYTLFIFFIPNRINDEEDYLIATKLFDFNDMVDFCKNKYNSVKKLLTYFKHFFNTKNKK